MLLSPASSFSFWQLLLGDFVQLWSKQHVANVDLDMIFIHQPAFNINVTGLNAHVVMLKSELPHHQNHPQKLRVSAELMLLLTLSSVARSGRT